MRWNNANLFVFVLKLSVHGSTAGHIGTTFSSIIGKRNNENNKNVNFLLYNQNNNEVPVYLNYFNLREVNPYHNTKIITFGVNYYPEGPWIIQMKNEFLKTGQYNIIVVDWSPIANLTYIEAYYNVGRVGELLGDFVFDLVKHAGILLQTTHLIGHSLGAHVNGIAGQRIQERTNGYKAFRITGLDAAGPLFEFGPIHIFKSLRLSDDDAVFVDGIHTNGGNLGYLNPYGTADFYVNGGKHQPTCETDDASRNTSLTFRIGTAICSHTIGPDYYIKSINSYSFIATKCTSYENYQQGACIQEETLLMGENCPYTASGNYYLHTTDIL